MAAPILPISSITLPGAVQPAGQAKSGGGFQEVFASAVNTVETAGQNAAGSTQRFLAGEGEELHTTLLATQQAELSFDLFMQARNKVVSAYQEIMRMQM
jgi:flagellar hook-basal body complex protein FliE